MGSIQASHAYKFKVKLSNTAKQKYFISEQFAKETIHTGMWEVELFFLSASVDGMPS